MTILVIILFVVVAVLFSSNQQLKKKASTPCACDTPLAVVQGASSDNPAMALKQDVAGGNGSSVFSFSTLKAMPVATANQSRVMSISTLS